MWLVVMGKQFNGAGQYSFGNDLAENVVIFW